MYRLKITWKLTLLFMVLSSFFLGGLMNIEMSYTLIFYSNVFSLYILLSQKKETKTTAKISKEFSFRFLLENVFIWDTIFVSLIRNECLFSSNKQKCIHPLDHLMFCEAHLSKPMFFFLDWFFFSFHIIKYLHLPFFFHT